ncbi:hypothetical protein HK105_206747 [Polyrhizophydium stewartii]|uniref:Uncharacterized protein n=1 Tax=Polyrhizophydium stewartii TaxID=2732419 RepID=A0ABR4N2G5_9FUNG
MAATAPWTEAAKGRLLAANVPAFSRELSFSIRTVSAFSVRPVNYASNACDEALLLVKTISGTAIVTSIVTIFFVMLSGDARSFVSAGVSTTPPASQSPPPVTAVSGLGGAGGGISGGVGDTGNTGGSVYGTGEGTTTGSGGSVTAAVSQSPSLLARFPGLWISILVVTLAFVVLAALHWRNLGLPRDGASQTLSSPQVAGHIDFGAFKRQLNERAREAAPVLICMPDFGRACGYGHGTGCGARCGLVCACRRRGAGAGEDDEPPCVMDLGGLVVGERIAVPRRQ